MHIAILIDKALRVTLKKIKSEKRGKNEISKQNHVLRNSFRYAWNFSIES
jgi:hypothetical protein